MATTVTPTTTPRRPLLRRPVVLIGLAVGAVLLVIALSLFQPWKLFVDREVDEALPGAGSSVANVDTVPDVPAPADRISVVPAPSAPVPAEAAAPGVAPVVPPAATVVLARGEFISHEHASSGSVVVLKLADGSRVLRLENLDTSDGPLLKV